MSKKKTEDPVVVERSAIREAGRRRLRGEGPTSSPAQIRSVVHRKPYHGPSGDVSSSMAFNPLINRNSPKK
ncbi:MAG: hypothetical protein M3M85_03010 [bacterium]|nr:hypothetical protein [bacterium]